MRVRRTGRVAGVRHRGSRPVGWRAGVVLVTVTAIGVTVGGIAAAIGGDAATKTGTLVNACANPVLDRDLSGWGGLGGITATRVSVGAHVVADHGVWVNNLPAVPRIFLPQKAVSPGERWTFAVDYWVDRASNPTGQMIVDWYDAAGTYLSASAGTQVAVPSGPTERWTRVAGDFTVPANAARANVLAQLNANTTGASWIATACDYRPATAQQPTPTSTPAPTTAAPSPTPTNPPPPPPGTAGKARTFWLHLNSTATSDSMLATEARRRSFVILNAWEGALIPKLKAANPAIQVYVYKDLSSTRSYACRNGVDDQHLPAGVGYCDANNNHPEWFLTAPSGSRYQYSGYAGHWQMDVGNVAYQNAWAANVIRSARAAGFDGVEMDNALFACDTYHSGSCPTRYPNNTAMQNAYKSMLANVRDDFQAAGLKAVANLANARLYPGAWDAYTQHLDGGFDEWWLTFSDTDMLPEYAEGWSRVVGQIESNEARGKITWVQPHFSSGAVRPFRYAYASYLMAAGGRAAFTEIAQTDGYGNPTPWHAEYDWSLGAPTGARASIGTNLWRRDFTCGAAIVNANPTSSGAQTIQLSGSFVNQDGQTVSSVSLAGTSGAVLRRPNCTP
jgi:hypothetical protein